MIASVVLVFVVICSSPGGGLASPVSQPTYPNNQYYAVPQQYLQQVQSQQPQYISAPPIPQAPTPVYEGASRHQVPQQFIQRPPTQRVAQLLLPSAADRQVQKAAEQIAGPEYAQQVQIAQQQGLANQALATAQRRAELQLKRAQLQAQQSQQQIHQPQQQQQQQPQQQYIEIAPRPQYLQVHVPQQAQQAQQYQLQYEPAYPQPVQPKPLRAIPQQQQSQHGGSQLQRGQEPEEEHDNNSSYQFGFDVKDDLYTNYQNRKEQREGGKISGSYSVVDSDGFIRTVTYTADPKEGFKAEVVRKPTDIVVKIPQPPPPKEQQPQEPHQQYIQEVSPQRYQQQPQQQQQQQKPNLVYQYQ